MKKIFTLGILIIGSLFITNSAFAAFTKSNISFSSIQLTGNTYFNQQIETTMSLIPPFPTAVENKATVTVSINDLTDDNQIGSVYTMKTYFPKYSTNIADIVDVKDFGLNAALIPNMQIKDPLTFKLFLKTGNILKPNKAYRLMIMEHTSGQIAPFSYIITSSDGTGTISTTAPTAAKIAELKAKSSVNADGTTGSGNGGGNTGSNNGNGGGNTGNSNGNGGNTGTSGGGTVITLKNPLKFDSIPAILAAIVTNVVLPIAVPIFIIMLIYCGIKFVLARGNPEALKQARESLKWTLIGGAVILGSYAIAELVANTIGTIVGK